jgi:hypothetical protein
MPRLLLCASYLIISRLTPDDYLHSIMCTNVSIIYMPACAVGACLDQYSSEDRFIRFMDGHGYDHVKVSVPGILFGSEERAFFRKRIGTTPPPSK